MKANLVEDRWVDIEEIVTSNQANFAFMGTLLSLHSGSGKMKKEVIE